MRALGVVSSPHQPCARHWAKGGGQASPEAMPLAPWGETAKGMLVWEGGLLRFCRTPLRTSLSVHIGQDKTFPVHAAGTVVPPESSASVRRAGFPSLLWLPGNSKLLYC